MMKRMAMGWAGAVLTGVIVNATGATAQTPVAAADTNLVPVLKTAQPVTVDGALDEDCWKSATPVKADCIWGGSGKMSAEPRMLVRYAWDDRYLYIAYETFDANLVAKGNGIVKGPADNRREGCLIASETDPVDVVEFFVGFSDPNMFWETHHTASNAFNDILVFAGLPAWKKERSSIARANIYWAFNEYIQDDGAHKLASAARPKTTADGKRSTVNDAATADTGYTAELRLPWAGLGAPAQAQTKEGWGKMAGRSVAILAVVQNGDLKDDRYHTSCPTLPKGDFFHNHFDKWPRYRLVAEGPEPAGK